MSKSKITHHLRPTDLEGGLVLRTAVSEEDIRSAVDLLGRVFEPTVGGLVRAMVDGYPGYGLEGFFIMEDPSREPERRVVSTLSLIDKPWVLGDVTIPVANLEFVATDPDYRGRGLSKALYQAFDTAARQAGYTVSSVAGIPHFYGKLGYSYAVPLGASISLAVAEVAQSMEANPLKGLAGNHDQNGYRVREAGPDDVPEILALYEKRAQGLDLYGFCSREIMHHLVRDLTRVGRGSRYVVEEAGASAPGAVTGRPGGKIKAAFSLYISTEMASLADLIAYEHGAVLEALRWTAVEAGGQGHHRVRVDVSPQTPEHEVARTLGPRAERQYGWQVRLIDRPGFLSLIGPVLERRLAGSLYHGLSHDLVIDLYESSLLLRWEKGRLAEVSEKRGPAVGGGIRVKMPEHAFTKLAFGYRSVGEMADEHPDMAVPRFFRPLLDVLFPKLKALIHI